MTCKWWKCIFKYYCTCWILFKAQLTVQGSECCQRYIQDSRVCSNQNIRGGAGCLDKPYWNRNRDALGMRFDIAFHSVEETNNFNSSLNYGSLCIDLVIPCGFHVTTTHIHKSESNASKVHLLQKNNHIVGVKNAIKMCLLPIRIPFQQVCGVSKPMLQLQP